MRRFHLDHPGQLLDTVATILQDASDNPINDEDMNFMDFLSGACNFQRPPNGVYGINPPTHLAALFHWRIFATIMCQLDMDDRESFQFYSKDYLDDFGFQVFGPITARQSHFRPHQYSPEPIYTLPPAEELSDPSELDFDLNAEFEDAD
jgi:hypothetical protein